MYKETYKETSHKECGLTETVRANSSDSEMIISALWAVWTVFKDKPDEALATQVTQRLTSVNMNQAAFHPRDKQNNNNHKTKAKTRQQKGELGNLVIELKTIQN